jgi:hypothetical protein
MLLVQNLAPPCLSFACLESQIGLSVRQHFVTCHTVSSESRPASYKNVPRPQFVTASLPGGHFLNPQLERLEDQFPCKVWTSDDANVSCFRSLQDYHVASSRDSVVSTATGYGLDDQEVRVRVPVGARIFSSPRRPDRLSGPPSFLFNQ